ncbi:MAG: Dna2/Cas4 domain-containing protein [Candidatus Poseidoniaceae archaeon]|nr:Dna2/Cas4 domain-containing protein [Candidatus Poseidoniaceae archaeon]
MANTFQEKTVIATESDDGYWRNADGETLHVSASDLERHAYCPLSWSLARSGKVGKGEAVAAGRIAHSEIHKKIGDFKERQLELRKAFLIWSWWFTIIFIFIGDAIIFINLDYQTEQHLFISKLLTIIAISVLIIAILAIFLPWRKWIDFPTDKTSHLKEIENLGGVPVEPVLQPIGFVGGWYEGGRIEASLMILAIVFGLHALALPWAENKTNAGFILITIAMIWTFLASWQLQRALLADNAMEIARINAGIDENTDVAYSDDDATAGLLVDNLTGLRGRPDQIVIVDGEFIPVEQKTGKVPNKPHKSHKLQLLAYLHLVEATTNRKPPYGVLKYSGDNLHPIDWDSSAKKYLMASIKEVQRLMVEGGAERNHERIGKCQSCSRRYACPDSLV